MIDENELRKNDMVAKLAGLLIDRGLAETMTEALDMVINSETYEILRNEKSGLYYQSPLYVFDFLVNELSKGKIS